MPALIQTVVAVALIGGFAFLALRAARDRRDRGGDVWIGGEGGADSGSAWGMSDSGPGAVENPGGGDFGGGGASGGWDDGGGDGGGYGDGGGGGGGGD